MPTLTLTLMPCQCSAPVAPAADESRARYFHQTAAALATGHTDAYTIFLRLIQRNDWFTQEKACLLLTAVIASRPNKDSLRAEAPPAGGASTSSAAGRPADVVEQTVVTFVDWLCGQLRRPSNATRSVPTAVHALSHLLRELPIRAVVYSAGGVPLLAALVTLPSNGTQLNIQLLYEASLSVWELSFYQPAADMLAGGSVVGGLVDMVRLAHKEKLVRVALLALRNLLSVGSQSLEYAVVEKGLPKAVENRQLQVGWAVMGWGDVGWGEEQAGVAWGEERAGVCQEVGCQQWGMCRRRTGQWEQQAAGWSSRC